ncbi:S-adenosylmethionine decarboxylase family protein [uncultured Megasphaera sp.]|uniref:S-adenosylmethionine decarboxylase family protein n=1 Tax=uncultured Megasphaera sp. TaxID=165188 RepID=UPI002658A8FD|nr:S-adenosylmethionine decarboxylase [uncultured Megasphaera sp.]
MNNTLGKHLLIDFYNCKAKWTSPEELHTLVSRALELAGAPLEGHAYYEMENEMVCMAVSAHAHICIHAYPELAYVAIDIYSFNVDLQASQIMHALKNSLQSDRIKATSVRRGDFGSIRDMRPKRNSKITTVRRMKNTGATIKKTSVKMFNILRHPQKMRRSRRTPQK